MAILKIELEDEARSVIDTCSRQANWLALDHLLADAREEGTAACVAYIDEYGDTVFNQPQMEPFIAEWERLSWKNTQRELDGLFKRVLEMAQRCAEEPHLFLRFVGD